jgi:hypothetical protein
MDLESGCHLPVNPTAVRPQVELATNQCEFIWGKYHHGRTRVDTESLLLALVNVMSAKATLRSNGAITWA